MSTTATLTYHATATGPVSPTALKNAMMNVILDPSGIEQATGAVLSTDMTTLLASVATRILVFNIAGAAFQTAFPPTGDQAAPFRGLYLQALSAGLNTILIEDPVIIA